MRFIKITLFFILTFLSHSLFSQKKPNIVIIISDDHSYQSMGAYGSVSGHTRNMDGIAKERAIFHRSYVVNSSCGPSRAALLPGQYGNKHGFKEHEICG